MGHGWERLRRGPVLPALPVCLVVALVAVRFAPGGHPGGSFVYSTAAAKLPDGPLVSVPVAETKGASAHHLQIADAVKPHVHRRHDEAVVVLAGRGWARVGADTTEVGPGTVIVVPRGTVHGLLVTEGPVVAISVFSPPFSGKDRVFVDE